MPLYQYESVSATVIIFSENQDDADSKLVDIVREPNTFDLTHSEVV